MSNPALEHAALQATEAAVEWMQQAVEAGEAGTRNAWEAQGHWKQAIRYLQAAIEHCEAAGRWPGITLASRGTRIERDAQGQPVQLVWRRE